MKKITLAALIFLTATIASTVKAQTNKSKKINLGDGSQLVYEVSENGKTKNGTYVVNNRENKGLWMNGYYKDDTPIGTWTFFNSKYEPALRYNYSQKKVTYINNDSFKDISVKVLSNDTSIAKGASIPIPLCSLDELKSLISSKIYLLYDNVHDDMDVTVTARINKEGKASYTAFYPSSNGKMESSNLTLNNGQFKIVWLPSRYNNEPVDSEFSLVIKITPANAERWHRFRWDI